MLDYLEVKNILQIWINQNDWDVKPQHEDPLFSKMIEEFESLGFKNLDTDLILEALIENIRDKHPYFSEEEVMPLAYEKTQYIESIVYSQIVEEDS